MPCGAGATAPSGSTMSGGEDSATEPVQEVVAGDTSSDRPSKASMARWIASSGESHSWWPRPRGLAGVTTAALRARPAASSPPRRQRLRNFTSEGQTLAAVQAQKQPRQHTTTVPKAKIKTGEALAAATCVWPAHGSCEGNATGALEVVVVVVATVIAARPP